MMYQVTVDIAGDNFCRSHSVCDLMAQLGLSWHLFDHIKARPRLSNNRSSCDNHHVAKDRSAEMSVKSFTCEVWMDSTLHADFGCSPVPSLGCSPGDFGVGQQIRGSPQLLRHAPLAERAEAALVCAPVGVVDVPAAHTQNRHFVAFSSPPVLGALQYPLNAYFPSLP